MDREFKIGPKFKSLFKIITRFLAIPTAILTCLILYDMVSPASDFDQAKIISKYTYRRHKGGISYNIKAKGNFSYDEEVSKKFFDAATVGNIINVSLSKFFGEWKSLELIHKDKTIIKTTGKDIYYLGIFGLLFLAALLAFLPEEILFSRLIVPVILIPVLNFVAILVWIKLILVWMGIVEKM